MNSPYGPGKLIPPRPVYDLARDVYTIENRAIHGALLRFLFNDANDGIQLELTIRDGNLSYRVLNPEHMNLEKLP